MLKTKTLEMGGIYREDFVEYFLKIGGKSVDQETFKGHHWEVFVGPEIWRTLGSLSIHHVYITFIVEEDQFDDFLAEFHMNFLKAGG